MKDYDDYLMSPHWRQLAEETKRLAGYRCQLCNGEGTLHAHHRTYDRIDDELQSDLVALCASCHAKFHDKNQDVLANVDGTEIEAKDLCDFRKIIKAMYGIDGYGIHDRKISCLIYLDEICTIEFDYLSTLLDWLNSETTIKADELLRLHESGI
jgi:hypothetical protein